jgi:hypothetical protein
LACPPTANNTVPEESHAPFAQTTGIRQADTRQISELLADNIVFNSPILARPIQGRELIAPIFTQSSSTRGSGAYTAEFKLEERTTFLRCVGTMDGHKLESMEIIVDNEQWLIVERTIALRPYPALSSPARRPPPVLETVSRRDVCSAQG